MISKGDQPISAEQAARLIYRTDAPDHAQVGAVCKLMQRGDLRQSAKRHFTTTRSAVAEYLAEVQLQRCDVHRPTDDEATPATSRSGKSAPPGKRKNSRAKTGESSNRHLRVVYRDLLNDYFRSVVFCGRKRDRSPQFRRAVLGLQIAILLVLLSIGGWSIRTMLAGESFVEEPWMAVGRERVEKHNPGERRIVESWLRANRKSAELLDLLPGHRRPGGKALRVRYRWTWKDGETKLDDQIFILRGPEVLRQEDPDPEDDALEQRLSS